MTRLKELRQKKKMNMAQIARALGIAYTTYVSYEKGEREPNSEMLIILADFFNCSTDYLLGKTDIENSETPTNEKVIDLRNYGIRPIETKTLPLLGDVACGKPIFANEEKELYIKAGTNVRADFCLQARGDSMIDARINDGDIVFIRSQNQVDNGEIGVVIIDDEATLKRVYYYPEKNTLILKAANPKYEDFIFTNEELNSIHIIGKAVAFQSDVI